MPAAATSPIDLAARDMILVEGGTLLRDEGAAIELGSFYLSKHPVTQELWEAVTGANPSGFQGARRPVEQVSWYDAVEFCNRLSTIQGYAPAYTIDKGKKDPNNKSELDNLKWLVLLNHSADGYRLPTEAEWEYAARGGIKSQGFQYAGGEKPDEVAWHKRNSHGETKPVGLKLPNELDLHDMSGNVWEWCWDWYGDYPGRPETNYHGPASGSSRVCRGGSWDVYPQVVRVADRGLYAPGGRLLNLGFRLARAVR